MTRGQFPQTDGCCSRANLFLFIDAVSAARLFFSFACKPASLLPFLARWWQEERRRAAGPPMQRPPLLSNSFVLFPPLSPSLPPSFPGSLTRSPTACCSSYYASRAYAFATGQPIVGGVGRDDDRASALFPPRGSWYAPCGLASCNHTVTLSVTALNMHHRRCNHKATRSPPMRRAEELPSHKPRIVPPLPR